MNPVNAEFEAAFRKFGPGNPRVQYLEAQGASFDPSRLSWLLEDNFQTFGPGGGRIRYLEERHASLDPSHIPRLIEHNLQKFGRGSQRLPFLVERMLENLELRGLHKDAWAFATHAFHRIMLPRGSGLFSVFYDLIKRGLTEHSQSVLSSVTVKLDLLSCSPGMLDIGISPLFRQWLSDCLTADKDPGIAWIALRKGTSVLRVQRDVLTYWSNYFARLCAGNWKDSLYVVFDGNEAVTSRSFHKIFGQFITTGVYEWTGEEDCDLDYQAAQYFGITKLEDLLSGIGEDDRLVG